MPAVKSTSDIITDIQLAFEQYMLNYEATTAEPNLTRHEFVLWSDSNQRYVVDWIHDEPSNPDQGIIQLNGVDVSQVSAFRLGRIIGMIEERMEWRQ